MSYLPTRENLDALYHRLGFNYGYEHAVDVLRGRDGPTNADQAAWRALGGSKPYVRRVVRR